MEPSIGKTAFVDETGKRYGRLLVIKRFISKGKAKWHCLCDCGTETISIGNALRNGTTQSCGCLNREILKSKFKDEKGNKYGRLTVIEKVEGNSSNTKHKTSSKGQGALWLCKCECGTEIRTRGSSLRAGVTASCGCLAVDKSREVIALPYGEAAKNQAIRAVKRSAKDRNLKFELDDQQIVKLMEQPCYYCGTKTSNKSSHPDMIGDYYYNGVDRVDNNIGYIIENVVSCCKHCNIAKRTRTVTEFLTWIETVYNHSIKEKGQSFHEFTVQHHLSK